MDINALIRWFQNNKRDLPWRHQPKPYAVWISEVMLQQTQVSVVIPYFERWMDHFPTIEALAAASLDKVIKLWEGLGYYSRARNLHAGACYVVQQHQGHLPNTAVELSKIKGIGDYTVGAILSFAFHQKIPAIDGNVLRVLSRYFALHGDIAKTKTKQEIKSIACAILPDHEPWVATEALIELGALICQKKPLCRQCPLNGSCAAFANGLQETLPIKSAKIKTEQLYRAVAIIACDDHLLIRRVKQGEIMSDLHEFPYVQIDAKNNTEAALKEHLANFLGLDLSHSKTFAAVGHSFTRYQATLFPLLFTCSDRQELSDYCWIPVEEIAELAFSSGHRRILQLFQTDRFTQKNVQLV
jgi:A/G-specific adenine glycosylase